MRNWNRFPKKLWMLYPWKHMRPSWMGIWATWCSVWHPSQWWWEVRTRWSLRSFQLKPFYDYNAGFHVFRKEGTGRALLMLWELPWHPCCLQRNRGCEGWASKKTPNCCDRPTLHLFLCLLVMPWDPGATRALSIMTLLTLDQVWVR